MAYNMSLRKSLFSALKIDKMSLDCKIATMTVFENSPVTLAAALSMQICIWQRSIGSNPRSTDDTTYVWRVGKVNT
jgi:hypothetical protein